MPSRSPSPVYPSGTVVPGKLTSSGGGGGTDLGLIAGVVVAVLALVGVVVALVAAVVVVRVRRRRAYQQQVGGTATEWELEEMPSAHNMSLMASPLYSGKATTFANELYNIAEPTNNKPSNNRTKSWRFF
jgi:heme/copper-type cytochrome/quinol oxidase subunit 1